MPRKVAAPAPRRIASRWSGSSCSMAGRSRAVSAGCGAEIMSGRPRDRGERFAVRGDGAGEAGAHGGGKRVAARDGAEQPAIDLCRAGGSGELGDEVVIVVWNGIVGHRRWLR